MVRVQHEVKTDVEGHNTCLSITQQPVNKLRLEMRPVRSQGGNANTYFH